MEFITLKKDDPQVEIFLKGAFSNSQRALPVPSFRESEQSRQLNSRHELITFELVALSEIKKPGLARVLWMAARPELLPLSLYPLLSTLALLFIFKQTLFWDRVISAVLSVCAFHVSVFLLNDSSDHLRGLDAISRFRGSQIIQKGFLTAQSCQRWSLVFLVFGMGLALPCLLHATPWLLWLSPLVPLAIYGFSQRRFGLKYWGLGDLLIFLFFGPFLAVGFSLAIANKTFFWVIHQGIIWGWLAVVIFHLRGFENLFADSVVRSGTFLSRLGFDRAKRFLCYQLIAFTLVWASWALQMYRPLLWIPTVVYLGWVCAVDIKKIAEMRSPLNSSRKNLAQKFLLRLILAPLVLIGAMIIDRF